MVMLTVYARGFMLGLPACLELTAFCWQCTTNISIFFFCVCVLSIGSIFDTSIRDVMRGCGRLLANVCVPTHLVLVDQAYPPASVLVDVFLFLLDDAPLTLAQKS